MARNWRPCASGERNYIDIKLGKTKQPQRFGDITMRLDSVTPKKNMYSVDMMADDKLTLKKNKSINEPVQFYTIKGGHIPYELVINQVNKNRSSATYRRPKTPHRGSVNRPLPAT